MVGVQVTGKRVGIVGMGRVGPFVARRTRGFDMEVRCHNRRRSDPAPGRGTMFHESLEEMLPLCEVLSLNCPATPETADLLNEKRIALLPDRAIVINTARGALGDDDAPIAVLQSGKPYAAGLDANNNEPAIHSRYRDLTNAFLMPHIGSTTRETSDAMGYRALDNLDMVFTGREPGARVA